MISYRLVEARLRYYPDAFAAADGDLIYSVFFFDFCENFYSVRNIGVVSAVFYD